MNRVSLIFGTRPEAIKLCPLVLAWGVSITLELEFCVLVLERALSLGTPEIFNTGQDSQFTSNDFTDKDRDADVQISMDGKEQVFDNVFVERL